MDPIPFISLQLDGIIGSIMHAKTRSEQEKIYMQFGMYCRIESSIQMMQEADLVPFLMAVEQLYSQKLSRALALEIANRLYLIENNNLQKLDIVGQLYHNFKFLLDICMIPYYNKTKQVERDRDQKDIKKKYLLFFVEYLQTKHIAQTWYSIVVEPRMDWIVPTCIESFDHARFFLDGTIPHTTQKCIEMLWLLKTSEKDRAKLGNSVQYGGNKNPRLEFGQGISSALTNSNTLEMNSFPTSRICISNSYDMTNGTASQKPFHFHTSTISDCYDTFFSTLLANSKLFYQRKMQEWFSNLSNVNYKESILFGMVSLWNDEKTRVLACLPPSSRNAILSELIRILDFGVDSSRMEIEKDSTPSHTTAVIFTLLDASTLSFGSEHGQKEMLSDSSLLYDFFADMDDIIAKESDSNANNHPNLHSLFGVWDHWVGEKKKILLGSINEADPSDSIVKKVQSFYQDCMAILARWKKATLGPNFWSSIKTHFSSIVNMSIEKSFFVEFIVQYMDKSLLDSKMDETELETSMKSLVEMIGYVQDKDRFQEYYRTYLQKRLLVGKSCLEKEGFILGLLKNAFGNSFTQKMDGMIKDIESSKTFSEAFSSFTNQKHLDVRVFATNHWSFPTIPFTLPTEFHDSFHLFSKYYALRFSQRKLTWVHSASTVSIQAIWKHRTHELNMSMFQAAILLLFNERNVIGIDTISSSLGLTESQTKTALAGLSLSKYKILLKNDQNMYSVNETFSEKLIKISIPNAQAKVTKEESTKTQEKVERERVYVVDAAIVRILKMRKTLSHTNLVSEVIEALSKSFVPSVAFIKTRIEDLIVREYLERDGISYTYLA